jgi:hypothetical protein
MAAKYILAILACAFLIAVRDRQPRSAPPEPHLAACRRDLRRGQFLAVRCPLTVR